MLLTLALSGLLAVTSQSAEQLTEMPRWLGVHVTGHTTNRSLGQLAEQLPELARMGINSLVLEINYGFEYQSHPAPVHHLGPHA